MAGCALFNVLLPCLLSCCMRFPYFQVPRKASDTMTSAHSQADILFFIYHILPFVHMTRLHCHRTQSLFHLQTHAHAHIRTCMVIAIYI